MAARDTQRYYWVKISSKWFFRNHKIELVRDSEVGHVAILMYIFMLAESASHDGRLRCDDELPYTPENIVTLCHVPKEDGLKAFELLKRYNLVKIEDDGTIFLPEFAEYVGSETEAAARMREFRSRQSEGVQDTPSSETPVQAEEPKSAPAPSAQPPKRQPAAASDADLNETIDTSPLHAPFTLETVQGMVRRSAGSPRVMIGSKMICDEEIAEWFDFQETEGGWRMGDFKPITAMNFFGPLKAFVSARRRSSRVQVSENHVQRITREEFDRVISEINSDKGCVISVTSEEADELWKRIGLSGYKLNRGDVITRNNVNVFIRYEYESVHGAHSCIADEVSKAVENNRRKSEWKERLRNGLMTQDEYDALVDSLPS